MKHDDLQSDRHDSESQSRPSGSFDMYLFIGCLALIVTLGVRLLTL